MLPVGGALNVLELNKQLVLPILTVSLLASHQDLKFIKSWLQSVINLFKSELENVRVQSSANFVAKKFSDKDGISFI